MPADLLADILETGVGILIGQEAGHLVVEPQHGGVELGDDAVLVVARIADECPPVRPSGNLDGAGVVGVARHVGAEEHVDTIVGVHVRLIVRATPVQVVQVEARRPEINEVLQLTRG